MYWLILAEGESSQAVRSLAAEQSTYAAAVTGVMLLVCVMFVRERPEFTGRGAENPFTALRDIMRNRHASLLIFIIFIENLGFPLVLHCFSLKILVFHWFCNVSPSQIQKTFKNK